jgi:integrase
VASVYERSGKWYLRYRDEHGRWRARSSTAVTKTEAKRMAHDLERRCERQRLGIEEIPPEDGGGTLGVLLTWWLETYSAGTPSHDRNEYVVRKQFLRAKIANLRLVEVTAPVIEVFLHAKKDELSAQSVNHLRSFLVRAFARARRAGKFKGANPALDVARRKVPKCKPDYLRADEVPRVLAALDPKWRPLYATAIYTGMRRGEILGLLKSDVDMHAGLITVTRSHGRDITKGQHAESIPIASELVPYLKTAILSSPSALVFPAPNGERMRRDFDLEGRLRRTLKKAGIVLGYEHVCRKKDCGHSEHTLDAALRHCPKHGHKLWPKAKVRLIRFHDLRHTTGSLLMMAGVNPAAVQRILRHHDPRITTEIYGHLEPNYLRKRSTRFASHRSLRTLLRSSSRCAKRSVKNRLRLLLPCYRGRRLGAPTHKPPRTNRSHPARLRWRATEDSNL